MGAKSYRVKPFGFEGLVGFAEELSDCWLAQEGDETRIEHLAEFVDYFAFFAV